MSNCQGEIYPDCHEIFAAPGLIIVNIKFSVIWNEQNRGGDYDSSFGLN
jgi:hypothetical protein